MKPSDSLRERINPAWNSDVRGTIMRSLAAVDLTFEARKPSGRPSETQRERDADRAQLLKQLATHAGPMIRKSEIELARHKDSLFADRAAFREKAMQWEDPRSAALAKEMREHLRSLPDHGARMKLLIGPQASKLAQRAALETDSVLSGSIPAENLHQAEAQFLQTNFPNAFAALADREAGIEHAEASVRMAKNTLAKTADLRPDEFQNFYSEIKPA